AHARHGRADDRARSAREGGRDRGCGPRADADPRRPDRDRPGFPARGPMRARVLVVLLLVLPTTLRAAEPDYAKCRDIEDDKTRPACYDAVEQAVAGVPPSYLERHWKLGPGDSRIRIDDVQPHNQTYVLVGKWTNHANTQPSSPAPDRTVPEPIPYNNDEV